METLDRNGKRGWSKQLKRIAEKDFFVCPRTLKILLVFMPWLIKLISAVYGLVKVFRD